MLESSTHHTRRTTPHAILHKTARTGSGWDDRQQAYRHHFGALPQKAEAFNKGEGLGVWLRRSAGGDVPWKQKEYVSAPAVEVPARIAAASAGDLETLVAMLDKDAVARLADKDGLGRTVLHAAAANGQVEVVQVLAARCAGWPPSDDVTPPSTGDDLSDGGVERKAHRSAIKAEADRADDAAHRAAQLALKKKILAENTMTADSIADFFSDENAGFVRKSAPASKFRQKAPEKARYSVPLTPIRTIGDRGYGSRSAGDLHVPSEAWANLLNLRDRAGDTPLHLAAAEGHAQVVDELLYRGAEVETRNLAGRTSLHVASMNGHIHVIFILCSAGASARSRDREGRRAVDMTCDESVVQFLWALVSREVAVRGGPTPFGYGDDDSHVLLNHNDPRFAVENFDFDPVAHDDGSDRLRSAGKVQRMRTAGPIHTGARLPRLRPLSPLESPRHKRYGVSSYGYPRRGTAKTAKSVAFQLQDDDSEHEAVEETRLEGRNNIPGIQHAGQYQPLSQLKLQECTARKLN